MRELDNLLTDLKANKGSFSSPTNKPPLPPKAETQTPSVASPQPNSVVSDGPGSSATMSSKKGATLKGPPSKPLPSLSDNNVVCAKCNQPLSGNFVQVMGKSWHEDHFVCTHCSVSLISGGFFEHDGKPYCEQHYGEFFCQKCGYCSQPVTQVSQFTKDKKEFVTAIGQVWHKEHFFCAQCGEVFKDTFLEKNNLAFCEKCYYFVYAPKCYGCKLQIEGDVLHAMKKQWHRDCLVCTECKQGGALYEFEGKIYCEIHYHSKNGTLCYTCQTPIVGKCLKLGSKKYHPDHLKCTSCMKSLNPSDVKMLDDSVKCETCYYYFTLKDEKPTV